MATVDLSQQPISRPGDESGSQMQLLVPVSLSRHDLFHGHVFLHQSNQPGILLHTAEYPAYCPTTFPYDLGYCQRDSNVAASSLDFRNFLWFADHLYRLDTSQGSEIYMNYLLDESQRELRTLYEERLGRPLADVSFIAELRDRRPHQRVFVDRRP